MLTKKIVEAIKKGEFLRKILNRINKKRFYRRVNKFKGDEKKYLAELFKYYIGMEPNIDNPQSYNEKILWLKLYWRDERAYPLVDKYEVRNHIKEIGLEKILIPLYFVGSKIEEVNFNVLPNEFIIKTTHDSGGTFIVNDKNDKKQIKQAKNKIKWSLNRGVYNRSKEWVYERIQPRIIVEKLIKDPSSKSLTDYKIFCFNGKAKFLFVATDRSTDVKFDFFDLDWNWFDVKNGHENNRNRPEKPKNFIEMISIAEKISDGFPHVRVDLYNRNGDIFFGEMTFFHFSGFTPFEPEEFDYLFGKYLTLPEKNV